MSVVGKKAIDKVQFYENHVAGWTTNAVAIGTTATIMTDLSTKTTAARDAYNAQQLALETAKAATLTWHNAVDAMAAAGSDVLKQIRAKAGAVGDSVYVLAQIPPPATPTPAGPPGTPNDFKVALTATGALQLSWKCTNPAGGTIYQISRKVGDASDFSYLGGTGAKTFVDDTVPAGTSSIVYKLQAVRSTAVGAAATFIVTIGSGASGQVSASIAPLSAPKMAA